MIPNPYRNPNTKHKPILYTYHNHNLIPHIKFHLTVTLILNQPCLEPVIAHSELKMLKYLFYKYLHVVRVSFISND